MSKDLISRQDAIDAAHKNYDGILDFRSDGETVAQSFEDILTALPSAEPERKKGQWIWCISSDHLKCSECGTRAPMYMDYANGDYQEWLSDICPECGCEMKGLEEDE